MNASIAAGFLKSLGFDPEAIMGIAARLTGELDAFKRGFGAATAHYTASLARIEKRQDEILALLKGAPQQQAEIVRLEDRRMTDAG